MPQEAPKAKTATTRPPPPSHAADNLCARVQGGKGTADKAMPKMKPGGVFLLLPGGEGGSLSKNPKPGVRQISG